MAETDDERISPEEYGTWWQPREALNALKPISYDAATALIIDHARAGEIRAAAKLIQFTDSSPDRPYQVMSVRHWKEVRIRDLAPSYFWDTGTIKEYSASTEYRRQLGVGYGSEDDEQEILTLGVRFEPKGIAALRPRVPPRGIFETMAAGLQGPQTTEPAAVAALAAPALLPATAPTRPRGGRPEKPFWEDLWIEMVRQVWEGDLKLNKQADLERAMLDWASANGHELSERAARMRAQRLFRFLSQKGQ